MSKECDHIPEAVLRVCSNIGREKIQRAQAVRHDEFITILKLSNDAFDVDVGSFLGKIATIRVCNLVHCGLGLYWNPCCSNRRRSSFLEANISRLHMSTLGNLGVKVDGGRDEVDMGLNILRDRVVIAGDMSFTREMLVQEKFRLQ